MDFIVSAMTDIGLTKSTNQDSYVVRVFRTRQGKVAFAVLCDGMGGLSKGEVASASVVRAFCRWAEDKLPSLCEKGITDAAIREDWVGIATEFNEKIKAYAASCNVNMGTTVTAILITGERYYVINVGDTRAYELAETITVMTRDHTLVAREVELGHITSAEAEADPRRSVLLQCIGASEVVCPDMFFGTPKPNAVYMLCSDGFRHEITEHELYQYLNPHALHDAEDMQRNICALIELNKQRQERDNISVIAIRTF